VACSLRSFFRIIHFLLFVCFPVLSVCRHSLRSLVIGRSIDQCPRSIKSPWGRGRRRGHHPAPHRMPFNKRSFFLAATAIELALLLGYGRSQYTGNCTKVINSTLQEALLPFLRPSRRPARCFFAAGSPCASPRPFIDIMSFFNPPGSARRRLSHGSITDCAQTVLWSSNVRQAPLRELRRTLSLALWCTPLAFRTGYYPTCA